MIEILLDAVKLALSEDVRKTGSGLIQLIRRSPDWQKDICTLEATVTADSREHAYLLGKLTSEKLRALHYPIEAIYAFEFVYGELTTNAFEYGCRLGKKDNIVITIEITPHFVSISIQNAHGVKFDLRSTLLKHRASLIAYPDSVRGRGLVFSQDRADELLPLANDQGVKAIFYLPPVAILTSKVDSVNNGREAILITILDGLRNPSLIRRLKTKISEFPEKDIILKFVEGSDFETSLITYTLELRSDLEAIDCGLFIEHKLPEEMRNFIKSFDRKNPLQENSE